MCNSKKIWTFDPYDIHDWNKSKSRIMLVAAEPNGGQEHREIYDMSVWFRTAPEKEFHGNRLFYNRCESVVDGYFCYSENEGSNFANFKFMDLKATEGGGGSTYCEVAKYINDNIDDVLKHFISKDVEFGLAPHVVVVMGGIAQRAFCRILRDKIIDSKTMFQYAFMPHPSARMSNEGFISGCKNLKNNLRDINEPPRRLCGKTLGWGVICKSKQTGKKGRIELAREN